MSSLVRQVKAISPRHAVLAAGVMLGGLLFAALGAALANAWRTAPGIATAFGASALAGAATGLGAVAIVFMRNLNQRLRAKLLGFSAGVMLAAAVLSLLWPALTIAFAASARGSALAVVVAAAVAGALAIRVADRLLPHTHPGFAGEKAKLWLMVVAIALHNIPEGFAVGASYAGGDALGAATAIAIGLQNVPEGLVVAAALAMLGYTPIAAIAVATLTGLTEPVGALVGAAAAGTADTALPIALAGAGGAMLFVVLHEMIPEAVRLDRIGVAASAAVSGIALMIALATI